MPSLDLPDQSSQSLKGLSNLVERVTPWLIDVGSWVFGGLIAFNLVVIASLITVGPADRAILIATTALACALPLNVAGIVLLRLTKDVKDIGIDDLALRAFQDAGFPHIEAYFPSAEEREALRRRTSNLALRYSLGIVALSIALTVTGMLAAMWHMAWWIAAGLGAMIVLSLVLLVLVIAHSMPPESKAEKDLKRRYRAVRTQAHK